MKTDWKNSLEALGFVIAAGLAFMLVIKLLLVAGNWIFGG